MVSRPGQQFEIADILRFKPEWWWDPVPEWVLTRLDDRALLRVSSMVLEQRAQMLEGQLQLIKQVNEVISSQHG
jgi:hypothetical protein